MQFRRGAVPRSVAPHDLLWALGSLCALHRLPFAAELVAREFPPPCTDATLISAARAIGLRVRAVKLVPSHVERQVFPLLVALKHDSASNPQRERDSESENEDTLRQAQGERDDGAGLSLGIVTAAADGQVVLFRAGSNTPQTLSVAEFTDVAARTCWLAAPEAEALRDPDTAGTTKPFGFRWFVPELLKHKPVWRDVLLASLALQLIALATPLFTQAIIDKVVVHRTQSTLITIGVAMMIFAVFTSLLTWVRQYLVLHTGNRVDAVLGSAVFDHLLKLPLRYFQHRPTGVVAARLHGV